MVKQSQKLALEYTGISTLCIDGFFGRMIKVAKSAIKAILMEAEVNDEELTTTIVGVESLLNSRPLTDQTSDDANDEPVLTPNHVLPNWTNGRRFGKV